MVVIVLGVFEDSVGGVVRPLLPVVGQLTSRQRQRAPPTLTANATRGRTHDSICTARKRFTFIF